MKKQNFSIHAPVFAGMRADMDQRLAEAVDMLRETGAEKATITVKINVSLDTIEVVSADNTMRPAKVPVMDYKISNLVKLASNSADVVDTGNLEIHKLVEGYELRPAGVEQMSMDDTDEDEEILAALAEEYPIPEAEEDEEAAPPAEKIAPMGFADPIFYKNE
jgi:hypothetical protein